MSSLGSAAGLQVCRDTHRAPHSKLHGSPSLHGLLSGSGRRLRLSRRQKVNVGVPGGQKVNGEKRLQLKTSSTAPPSSLTHSGRSTVRCASLSQPGRERSPFPAGASKIPLVPVTVPASQVSALPSQASTGDSLQDEEASWLSAGATPLSRRRSRERRSSSSSRSTVACQAVASVEAASPLSRKKRTPGRKAQSKPATCQAAATCEAPVDLRVTAVRSPEAESIPNGNAVVIPRDVTTSGVFQADNSLRGAQELLEHAWQLPCSPRGTQGQGQDLFRDSSEADVEPFLASVLSRRRSRRARSQVPDASAVERSTLERSLVVVDEDLEHELGRSLSWTGSDLSARLSNATGAVLPGAAHEEVLGGVRAEPDVEEALVSRLAMALSLAVAHPLPTALTPRGTTEAALGARDPVDVEVDILVKFPGREEELLQRLSPRGGEAVPSPFSSRSLPAVRRRRSVDLGRRLMVRSTRKRRLSLQSRVQGATSAQAQATSASGGPSADSEAEGSPCAGQKLPVSEAEGSPCAGAALLVSDDEAVLDALLKGYGWKGEFLLEWDSERRLLALEEEKQIIVLLEKGQALGAARAELGVRLGRAASLDDVARELGCSATQLRRTLQVYSAARNKLVMHNLGLVVNIARLYRSMGYGVDFSSLCQRGAKGLYDAADKFNSKRKCRFSTFASICVRTVVTREIASSMHVRAPTYSSYKFLVMRKAEKELEHKLQRRPTEKELAAATKVGVPKLKVLRRLFMDRPTLLHQQVKGGEGLQLADILPDRESMKGAVEKDELSGTQPESVRYALDDVIDSLKPKEALIIRQRFGLDGYGERSLAEIGRNLAISREMVRKYEARALAKLQLKERTELFHSCLCDYSN